LLSKFLCEVVSRRDANQSLLMVQT
jgi:hypothetical protein